jgi:hypothetical protein
VTTFSCSDTQKLPGDGGIAPGIRSCTDSNGSQRGTGRLNTSKLGTFSYFVRALSKDGSAASTQIHYRVGPNIGPFPKPVPSPGCSPKFPVYCQI